MVMDCRDPFVKALMKCLDIENKHVEWFELRAEVDEFVTLTMKYKPDGIKSDDLKVLETFLLEKK